VLPGFGGFKVHGAQLSLHDWMQQYRGILAFMGQAASGPMDERNEKRKKKDKHSLGNAETSRAISGLPTSEASRAPERKDHIFHGLLCLWHAKRYK
jgi:hypothetical protein